MQNRLARVEKAIGYSFNDQALITAAITHPSAAEGQGVAASYERLEFLGDAILGAIVSGHLYSRFADMDEGALTRLKISLIAGSTLSEVADGMGLSPLIVMGESEKGTHVRGMRHALEDVFEAIVAAIYLDGGLDECRSFVERTLLEHLDPNVADQPISPKSLLQQYTQQDLKRAPSYRLVEKTGPAHSPVFTSVAVLDGQVVGYGRGKSKKESESAAAMQALEQLGYVPEAPQEGNEAPAEQEGSA